MPINTFNNGDLLGSVRNASLNPLIVAHNGLETTVTGHTSDIHDLSVDNTANKADITALELDNTTNKTNIATNTSDINAIEGNLSTLATTVGVLSPKVTVLEADNTTNKAAIASLTPTVSTLSSDNTTNKTDIQNLKTFTTRVKSELDWTGLDVTINDGVKTNLITVLKAIPQSVGSWSPMFDTTANKMIAGVNDNRTLLYKINIYGDFSGPSNQTPGTIQVDFEGGVTQRNLLPRDNLNSSEVFSVMGFISVDKNGNFASNGCTISLTSLNRNFTITAIRLIAEQ